MSSSARRGLKRQCLAPAAPKQCSALVRAERGERRGGTSRSMSREVSPSMLRTIKRLPSSPHYNWRTALGSLRDAGRPGWASVSGFWPQALRPGSCFRTDTPQNRGREASRQCASSSLARARIQLRPLHVSETLTAPQLYHRSQPRTGASLHDAEGSPWESSGLLRS